MWIQVLRAMSPLAKQLYEGYKAGASRRSKACCRGELPGILKRRTWKKGERHCIAIKSWTISPTPATWASWPTPTPWARWAIRTCGDIMRIYMKIDRRRHSPTSSSRPSAAAPPWPPAPWPPSWSRARPWPRRSSPDQPGRGGGARRAAARQESTAPCWRKTPSRRRSSTTTRGRALTPSPSSGLTALPRWNVAMATCMRPASMPDRSGQKLTGVISASVLLRQTEAVCRSCARRGAGPVGRGGLGGGGGAAGAAGIFGVRRAAAHPWGRLSQRGRAGRGAGGRHPAF